MWRRILLFLTAFSAISALVGFYYLGFGPAADWPRDYIARSGFTSYFWPALVLLLAVGGPQGIAFVLLLRRQGRALLWSAVAGYAMVIWIIGELILFHVDDDRYWISMTVMQSLYAAVGLFELGCILALLGVFRAAPLQS